MKIAIIFPKDSEALFNRHSNRTFGGANVQMFMIARELANHSDVETCSLIPNYKTIDFDDAEKFNLAKTFNETDSLFRKIFTYHKTFRKIKPDFILQRGLTLESCLLAFYARLFGMKFIFMIAHDIESEGKYQKNHARCSLFFLLLRYAYLIIAQNELERDNIVKKGPSARVAILKKGLDFSKIKNSRKKQYDAIWIARCERWKNPEVFLDLAAANPKLRFCMICSKVDAHEAYFDEVRNRARGLTNVTFFDFVKYDEIYTLLAKSRVFCITSDYEGDWPMTVLEAAATGLPVLSYKLNYGGLLNSYNAGYHCLGSKDMLDTYLTNLIKDNKLLSEKSNKSIRYANEAHSIKKNVNILLKLILME
ncbi:MAG: glycosyltransferase family 4 protein [Sedimentisphaerales bacterium]|nr:glycosyltransferase family 4 protein [Sedimentisphaerales bacterium]